jgi:hypothetical protein
VQAAGLSGASGERQIAGLSAALDAAQAAPAGEAHAAAAGATPLPEGAAVSAAGLPRAAQVVLHEYLLKVLGAIPVRRSALDFFLADNREAAEGVQERRIQATAAAVTASGGAQSALDAAEAAQRMTWQDHVVGAWSSANHPLTTSNQRGIYLAREAADVRVWAAEARSYHERYQQLYRLIALQPALLALPQGADTPPQALDELMATCAAAEAALAGVEGLE